MNEITDEMEDNLPNDPKKPTYIHEQNNYNCQQFFGPITGCTFTMPQSPSTLNSTQRSVTGSKGKTNPSQPRLSDSTYCYRWQDQHPERITLLYQLLLRAGMIAQDTPHKAFEDIFSGEASTARVKWIQSQAWLWYLLRQMTEKKYIKIEEGQSIWMVASSHFIDKTGCLFSHQSFSKCKTPKKAQMALDRLAEILNPSFTLQPSDMTFSDTDTELWSGIKDRGWDLNR